MRASECPNEKIPDHDDRQESCRYPGTDCYPDSLLDAMLSGLIFFDAEGIIFRTNTTARKDLHLADSVAGCKLGDVCFVAATSSPTCFPVSKTRLSHKSP